MLIAARLKISERRALPGGLAAVPDAEPREVRLQARDEALIELPVVAELRAGDDSLAAQADAGGEAAVRVVTGANSRASDVGFTRVLGG
jgi:hypothetical protein